MTAVRLFLVAGEHSGDALGGRLMAALEAAAPGAINYDGVGGPHMEAQGLRSLFPLSDVAVMGPLDILWRLPHLVRRINEAAAAGVAARPDAVIIVDSPELTHPIARRIRRRLPAVPIIDYVSPSVWAWRPGRARRMRAYVDHVLALLPFEPEVHMRLGGPACTYVGHPLIERFSEMAAVDPAPLIVALGLDRSRRTLVVLPGSRRSEVERLMGPFGEALGCVAARTGPLNVIIPAVEHVREQIEAQLVAWPLAARVTTGEAQKLMAFKAADAALAASGTVTLELALAGTPMVVAYRVDALAARLQFLVKTPHFALSNLVLGERAFPELMQDDCTPQKLAETLVGVLDDRATRERQLRALARVPEVMRLPGGTPSEKAAAIVLRHARGELGRGAT
ncbi:MAG: lipid-A-disaccharide synthase [Hyphomicrobiaceae bacterium]|nr:lipid-A-disaccharide synthase [Hyphomicrobiaceae bacterium]